MDMQKIIAQQSVFGMYRTLSATASLIFENHDFPG